MTEIQDCIKCNRTFEVTSDSGFHCVDCRKETDQPVEVSLRKGAVAMHNAGYTNDLSERDDFIQEEYMDNARACAEAWGLKWK